MALDVLLRTGVTADDLRRAVAGHAEWTIKRSPLRGTVSQLLYANDATRVEFTLDLVRAGLRARLNVARPSFYGSEAITELLHIAGALKADVCIPGSQEPPDATAATGEATANVTDALLTAWQTLNADAWLVVERTGARYATMPADACLAWWRWQRHLQGPAGGVRRPRVAPESIPPQGRVTGRAIRASTWAEGQAEALPDVDLVLYLPSVDRTGGLSAIPARAVHETLADLLARTPSTDGVEVIYTPGVFDTICRERAAKLAASHPRFSADAYPALASTQLRDQ